MQFFYRAKKGPEEIKEGIIEATSQDAAVSELRQKGLIPVLVEKYTEKSLKRKSMREGVSSFLSGGGNISKKHVFEFTKKLKVLLKSHEPILNSLYFLEAQITNAKFKEVVHKIASSVKDGQNFSESLAAYPDCFPPLYISIIKAGEASGKLDRSLAEITKYMDNERQLSQKVISSLAYPAMMISVGILTIVFIITFVIPKLKDLFLDMADDLPLLTKILLNFSSFCSKTWPILVVCFIGTVFLLFHFRGAAWQKKVFSAVKTHTPVVKKIMYNQSLARFSGGMSILLSSGVSLLDSLRISIPLIEDQGAQKELAKACQEIVAGTSLEESLNKHCRYLPEMFVKMIAVGEASGSLDGIMAELSASYAEEVETSTKMMTSLIEPLAILVVGGVLSLIVIAVLLPIFEMSLHVK